jgi:hypothetical protein
MSAASYRLVFAGAEVWARTAPVRFLGVRVGALVRALDRAGAERRGAVPRFDLVELVLGFAMSLRY